MKADEQEKQSIKDGSYTAPKDGWTCYHCGVTFRKHGAARDHFGEIPKDKPKCQYHDLDVEKLEAENAKLNTRISRGMISTPGIDSYVTRNKALKAENAELKAKLELTEKYYPLPQEKIKKLEADLTASEKRVKELEAEAYQPVCDQLGCDSLVTCGTPTPTRYRNTCHKHIPREPFED